MKLPKELYFEQLSIEDKYFRAVPGYMKRMCRLYEAIYERYGEEGLALIRDVSTNFGTEIGKNTKKKHALKGLQQVGKYLIKVFDMVSDDWWISEFTDERLVISVSRCPYPFTNDKICEAHTHMEKALISTLDNNLEHSIGKSIPKGDPCCEHILRVKVKT
jgi:hypothetical protein